MRSDTRRIISNRAPSRPVQPATVEAAERGVERGGAIRQTGGRRMSEEPLPNSEIILYQTEDGRTRVQCRFESETVWLTQKMMAELFQIERS